MVQCQLCSKLLLDEYYLRCHMSEKHGDTMPFKCSLCGKGYQSQMGLSHHMQAHKGKTFMCPICDSKFTQKFTIKKHLRNIHMSMQCTSCSLILKLSEYNQHVLTCPP
ncbi:unnamed protein product [Lymnaea stagnalis]|uniref:C2H2-type domain-containing protein n=1 Tax=Lymnaea stagnalis TaxID=6523 RepID=A0AAV2HDB0_LYMST